MNCYINCPKEYPKLIKEKMKCVGYEVKNMIKNIIIDKTEEKFGESEIKYYNKIIYNIEAALISDKYDTEIIDNGHDEIIEIDKIIVTLTTPKNQMENINNNMTTINIDKCESILKEYYNMSYNDSLYIMKIDFKQEKFNISKTEFDIYSKLSGNHLVKLNKSLCNNSLIFLLVPIYITGNIDKFNISSGYFKDICYAATSDNGTDITLSDRRKELINSNKIVCQENCEFSGYNYTTHKATCSCKVQESSSLSFDYFHINKTKLFENFANFKNIANINILKCYRNLFNKINIIKNVGFYIISSIIIIHLISICIFFLIQLKVLQKKINDLIKQKKNYSKNALENNNIIETNNKNDYIKDKNGIIFPKRKKRKMKNSKKRTIFYNNFIAFDINIKNNNVDGKDNIIPNIDENNNERNKIKTYIKKGKEIQEINDLTKYNDEELNTLEYELALKYDKRTYWQYYISLLESKHNLIFSFYYNDYNSKIIKIDLFYIGFAGYYAINGLFFDDDTMHKIYETKGSYNLEYNLPRIIYSSLISIVLNKILKVLALSNDDILNLKQAKLNDDIIKRRNSLWNKIKIKFILYFIISFIFLLFFWYYISMFGAIYKNSQYHLLKDTLISFGLSLIYPFGIYVLPGLFRIPALSDSKNKSKYLYDFSKLLQMF